MIHLKNQSSHIWILTGPGNRERYIETTFRECNFNAAVEFQNSFESLGSADLKLYCLQSRRGCSPITPILLLIGRPGPEI